MLLFSWSKTNQAVFPNVGVNCKEFPHRCEFFTALPVPLFLFSLLSSSSSSLLSSWSKTNQAVFPNVGRLFKARSHFQKLFIGLYCCTLSPPSSPSLTSPPLNPSCFCISLFFS